MSLPALTVESERRFRYLFEQSSLGIAVEDLEGNLLLANPALCSMLGYREDELCGMSCSQFASPEDSEEDWAHFQQLRAGIIDHYSLEKRYLRKDGAQLWGRLNVSLLKNGDGGSPLVFAFVEDITAHKLAETEVARSEDRLRLALEAGKAVGWEWDIKSGRDTWFGDLRTMFGIPSDNFVGQVEDFFRYVHPEDRQVVAKAVADARQNRKPYVAEFRVVRLDGTVRWVAATGTFHYGADGDAERMLGMAVDITERKRADEAVQESDQRFRLVADSAPVLIWMSGVDKLCTYFNKPWLVFTGRSVDSELGNGWAEGVHPDDLQRCLDTYTQAFDRREEFRMEYRLRRHDGDYRWVIDIGVPRFNEESSFVGYIGVGVDVTERKLAEEALRESEERLRLAAQAGKMFAYEWDAATDVIVRSGEFAQILGTDEAAQVPGREILAMVHRDDRERLKAAVAELSPEEPYLQISYRMVRPDGIVIWVERNSRAHFDEQGRMLRIVGMVADITERKRAEERLREYEKAVEGSEEMIAVVDRDYRYLIANRKFLNFRNMTKEQVVGHLTQEVLNKGVFEADVKEKLDECFRGRVVRYEMKYTYPQLGERDVFVSYFPIEGTTGIDRAVCIVQDITDRKRAEEALQKSEERFRLAGQAGRMYAYEWDVATDQVMRSGEFANVLGVGDQVKQLTRQQLLASVHPDDRAWVAGSVDQVTCENPTVQISYRVLRPDGSVVWLEKSARGFFDEQGKLLRMIGMMADISERKRAEEALRESEDKLRLLLDSTAEAIYGIDLEHRCTFCNPACLRTLGYEHVDEVLGKNMHNLLHHTRADGTLFPVEECRVHRVTQTGEGVHADDEVLWRANGTSFPAEYWSYPQRRGERAVGAVVAFIDITQRKLAEAALASVSRRLIDVQEQERTRIARELHDDIGQRLALLAVELEQLRQDPNTLPGVLSRMGDLQKRASEIASDVQIMSHELHSSRLEYLGIVATMRGFCKEFGEQQKVEISFKTDDLPSLVPADVSLCLFRVLQEALHNSAKHSGVRHFEVRLWGTGDEVHLTVGDSGAGFDRAAVKESQGLGLISMEERLKLLKGTLSIESQPRGGTTIHACVPFSSGSNSLRTAS